MSATAINRQKRLVCLLIMNVVGLVFFFNLNANRQNPVDMIYSPNAFAPASFVIQITTLTNTAHQNT